MQWPQRHEQSLPSYSRDGIAVGEGMTYQASADVFHLGAENVRAVYHGAEPDLWLLEALTKLENGQWRIRNYTCDLDQDRTEIIFARAVLPKLGIIQIGIDLFLIASGNDHRWLVVESSTTFITAQDSFLTWARKEYTDGGVPGGAPDPPAGRTTGPATDPPATGAPGADTPEPIGENLLDDDPDRG